MILTFLERIGSMDIGYARVSTKDQDLSLQLDALTRFGCIKIFEEKVSGKNRNRPELEDLIEMLREGDRVVVYKLDRIGRSLKHLIELVEMFNKMGVEFVSLHENIDTSTAAGRMFFHIVGAFAQFEREVTVERTKAGLEAARARGRKGGRPSKDKKAVGKALKLYESKEYSIKEIEEMTGVSASTLYRRLKENG